MKYCIYMLLLCVCAGCQKSVQSLPMEEESTLLQSFRYIQDFIGKKPDAVELWSSEPLRTEMKKVLPAERYRYFAENMVNAKEIRRDQVLYTIAAQPDSVNDGYVVALFDTLATETAIIYLKPDTVEEFTSGQQPFAWPDEVRNLMFNLQQWQVYEGQLPCHDCLKTTTRLALKSIQADDSTQFFLQQTYADSSGYEHTSQRTGICHIRQDEQHDSVTYELLPEQSEHSITFAQTDDSGLALIDTQKNAADTTYYLKLKKM